MFCFWQIWPTYIVRIEHSQLVYFLKLTQPGDLFTRQKYDDAISIESKCHKSMTVFDIPVTLLCLYESIPEELEDVSLENHDVVLKRIVTKTGVK